MSRHEVPTRNERYEVIVGWDPPLDTFFAQVVARTRGHADDNLVLWVGTSRNEIPTLDALTDRLSPYATLPARLQETLIAESHTARVRQRAPEITRLLDRLETLLPPSRARRPDGYSR